MKRGVGLVEICVRRLPEDGTPVPKKCNSDTYHELCFMVWILFSTFVGQYIECLMTFVSSQQRQYELWGRTRFRPQC